MILTRGARITGAVLCALLAVIVAGWIVRDLGAVGGPGRLLRHWTGYENAHLPEMPTTSIDDLVLFVVYLVVALTVMRVSVAASALVATGVLTLALRLPGLWNIGTSPMDGMFSDELRTRALICAFVAIAMAVALIITAGAGRRPPAGFSERVPIRPGQGAGVLTFLLLGASAAINAAWEIRTMARLPELFPDWYLGGEQVSHGLIDPPLGWAGAVVVLLCLFAGGSALGRAAYARPFGLIAAGILLPGAAGAVIRSLDQGMLGYFGELPTESQLLVLSWTFEAIAALVVLIALAVRGPAGHLAQPYQGYDPDYEGYGGYGYGPVPGPGPGPGLGQGYGYPGSGPGPFGASPPPPPDRTPPLPPHQPPPPPSQPPPGW
ncbi:hypothetical protein ACFYXM_04515 [Streptomyces sp. NPDC002476]|uniref:hypothetical protein n=1 Tax=Streptomyces sp. NPDC002476 TaxID=3364648 RepID=UPI0036870DFA